MTTRIVDHVLHLELTTTERRGVRHEVVSTWLEEEPGTPTQRHRYQYFVERLSDASRIYLCRPARLNKGMDFVIKCEGFVNYKNGKPKPPGHKHLLAEIRDVVVSETEHRPELKHAIESVWACESPDSVLAELPPTLKTLRIERILKVAKWMFIEQDLTYWTESGRWKLRQAIEELVPWGSGHTTDRRGT